MKKIILLLLLFFLISKGISHAQSSPTPPKQEFFRASVEQVVEQKEKEVNGTKSYFQVIRVKIEDGSKKGKFTVIQNGDNVHITKDQLVKKGDQLIISKNTIGGKSTYTIYDYYRLNTLLLFAVLFFAAVVIIGGLKGLGSIAGMMVSLGVIIFLIVPQILKGTDPLFITIIGSVIILFISTYLAHGTSKKTSIALLATFISLFITAFLAVIAIEFNKLTGLGDEGFYDLQLGSTSFINIKGLFLSSIIIGTLGALNDITTTQAATIEEFKKTEPKLKFFDLFEKGIRVGKEHIASLVNTLVLAYVGSAFAIFIFLVLNPAKIPYWVILNNEILSDEIIKTVAGSMGLLLSVPIVTALAAYFFSRKKP
jgi:uncharacterized membrane protein